MKSKTLFIILCLILAGGSQAQDKQQHVASKKERSPTNVMKKHLLFTSLLLIALQANAGDFVVKNIRYRIISPGKAAVAKGGEQQFKVVRIPETVIHDSKTYTVSEIDEKAFAVFAWITEVYLPNSIKKIGNNAFASCFSLKRFNIPDSVEYIGELAFNHCTAPDTVRIPETVSYIGKNAFGASSNLKWIEVAHFNSNYQSVDGVLFNAAQTEILSFPAGKEGHYDIPPTISTIDDAVFYNSKLTSVKIPYGLMSIGKEAFSYCLKLQTVDIPPSVILIDERAFANCRAMTEINIPASVKNIGTEAFLECRSLQEIEIPSSIPIINERTFAYCTSLKSVNIKSATVRIIDKLAFSYCTSLKELTLPSTVFYVGHGAFYPCKELSVIRVHHVTPLKLNGYVFSDVNKNVCRVFVPANSIRQYKEAPEWKDFKNFIPVHYRFTVSFSQPENGALQLFTDSTAIKSGSEFEQSTEFTFSLSCNNGYEFDKFIINGIELDVLPPAFMLMDDTKIEIKLRRSKEMRERAIQLASF